MSKSGHSTMPWRLSWDTILLVVLCLAQLWSSQVAAMVSPSEANNVSLIVHLTRVLYYDPFPGLLLLFLILYVGTDLWIKGWLGFAVKFIALMAIIIALVILPTMAAIVFRQNTAPYLYVHDGVLQTEEAIKFLLAGKNPYTQSYTSLPVNQNLFKEMGLTSNPALEYFPYLPFVTIFSIPFYLIFQNTLGWYDQRLVYLIMFAVIISSLLRLRQASRERLAMVTLVALNPLFMPFFIEGRNDIVALFWLIGAIFLLQIGFFSWASILVGAAALSKQTSWFIIPFFILYVWQAQSNLPIQDRVRNCARIFMPAVLLSILVLLPFLIWDASRFLNAILVLPSGFYVEGVAYPIRSMGLGGLMLSLGLIKRPIDPFPFAWFQVLFGGVTLALLLYRQWRNNTIAQMIMNYGILLFVYLFFARSFVDNYLGFALIWLLLSAFLDSARSDEQK